MKVGELKELSFTGVLIRKKMTHFTIAIAAACGAFFMLLVVMDRPITTKGVEIESLPMAMAIMVVTYLTIVGVLALLNNKPIIEKGFGDKLLESYLNSQIEVTEGNCRVSQASDKSKVKYSFGSEILDSVYIEKLRAPKCYIAYMNNKAGDQITNTFRLTSDGELEEGLYRKKPNEKEMDLAVVSAQGHASMAFFLIKIGLSVLIGTSSQASLPVVMLSIILMIVIANYVYQRRIIKNIKIKDSRLKIASGLISVNEVISQVKTTQIKSKNGFTTLDIQMVCAETNYKFVVECVNQDVELIKTNLLRVIAKN